MQTAKTFQILERSLPSTLPRSDAMLAGLPFEAEPGYTTAFLASPRVHASHIQPPNRRVQVTLMTAFVHLGPSLSSISAFSCSFVLLPFRLFLLFFFVPFV